MNDHTLHHAATATLALLRSYGADDRQDDPEFVRIRDQLRAAVAGEHLPPAADGHWSTPEGREMAQRYAAMARADLAMPDRSDLGLANALYLVSGEIEIQTAAKERMRWLSVQLHLAREALGVALPLLEDELTQRRVSGLDDSHEYLEPVSLGVATVRAALGRRAAAAPA